MPSLLIGVVSDTHGLLRPQAVDALHGVDHIVHAGDIGKPGVLEELGLVAPVTAVRGNNDKGEWAEHLKERELLTFNGVSVYILHNLKELDLSPKAAGFNVVVTGHSHKPVIEERGGVLYINPGSIGPRRFKLPISLAFLTIENSAPSARIVELPV
jgi:putative phosphoesterase